MMRKQARSFFLLAFPEDPTVAVTGRRPPARLLLGAGPRPAAPAWLSSMAIERQRRGRRRRVREITCGGAHPTF